MPSAEITPSAQKVDKVIKRIEDGDIKIPAFQRGYVWDQGQVIELLDSVLNDYPIGSVLLWNTKEILKSTRNVAGFKLPDRPPDYPVNYVLDGQQRISSIYAVFSQNTEQVEEDEDYNPEVGIFEIYYDFQKREFINKEDITDRKKVFLMRNLLDTSKFLEEFATLDAAFQQDAKNLLSKFSNYEIPIVTISNRAKEEVGIIFERINNTGTKLSTIDLMVAWTWSDDFHLRESINGLLEKLEEKKFGGLNEKILLQAISGIIQNTTKTKMILELDPKKVKDTFGDLVSAMEKTVDFLSTDLGCASTELLPHMQQIVPISKFFALGLDQNAKNLEILKKWFWKTSFSRRYAAQTDEKMDADLQFINNSKAGDLSGIDAYSHSLTAKALIESKFSKSQPYTRAFLLLMAQKTPLDLVKSTKVDLGKALSAFNKKEYHHVNPRAFLKKRGLPSAKINALLNFCFLPADSNKKISGSEPAKYFFELIPADKYQDILKSNLLPLNKDIYKTNDYDEFLSQRANVVIEFVNELTS
jgi:hypothetical protein